MFVGQVILLNMFLYSVCLPIRLLLMPLWCRQALTSIACHIEFNGIQRCSSLSLQDIVNTPATNTANHVVPDSRLRPPATEPFSPQFHRLRRASRSYIRRFRR